MKTKIVLTGVKPTGALHLGNYIGAVEPSLRLIQGRGRGQSESGGEGALQKDAAQQAAAPPSENYKGFFFIADGHSLISCQEPETLRRLAREAAAAWLACGLDPEKSLFYLQSDIPEILELSWILACVTPKGLMNRAHSYKAARDQNESAARREKDLDKGVSMGLFSYPVLMAADILLFQADEVPVGRDQLQHLEMTRDIAQKFNRAFKTDLLKSPQAVSFSSGSLPGLDGRKMSKSHKNCISLFSSPKELRKAVMRIKTDSLPAGAPKDPENSLIFEIYKAFAQAEETESLKSRMKEGIAYGEAKEILFEKLNDFLKDKREVYRHYIESREIEKIWKTGQERARAAAQPFMRKIKEAAGLGSAGAVSSKGAGKA